MSLRDWINHLRSTRRDIIIQTPYGPTTEWCRHQAAINMRDDPEKRAMCEAAMVLRVGDFQKAMEEMRRCWPEAYENE
jgi:hypothetical protein